MTLQIDLKSTLDSSYITGDFDQFIRDLNLAAAAGKQYVLATEVRDGEEFPVAFETRNITRIRDVEGEHAFIGR